MARCSRRECARWRPTVLVRHELAGFRLDDAWYCSSACLELAARRRLHQARRVPPGRQVPVAPLKLGVLLIHQGVIDQPILNEALAEQRRSGLRLGAQLQRSGRIQPADALRALATQQGASYVTAIDMAAVRQAPGNLPRDAVRALGLVPFAAAEETQTLKVACVAPVPHLALSAMRELTGWTAEAYLVSDEVWPTLVEAYGSARAAEDRAPQSSTVQDVSDAAARVAHVARSEGAVRITQARCDPYLWVRLEGAAGAEDLLLSVDDAQEETTCLTAPMSR